MRQDGRFGNGMCLLGKRSGITGGGNGMRRDLNVIRTDQIIDDDGVYI
jgi:hypothetical protein